MNCYHLRIPGFPAIMTVYGLNKRDALTRFRRQNGLLRKKGHQHAN